MSRRDRTEAGQPEWSTDESSGQPPAGSAPRGSGATDGQEWLPGIAAGLAAFAAGYALLFAIKGEDIMRNFMAGFRSTGATVSQLEQLGATLPEQWKVVGMVYHTLHNVPYRMEVTRNGQSFSQTIGREFLAGELLPWLIPMAVLVVAGFLLARHAGSASAGDGAATGASVATGYLVAAIGTTFVFTWSATLSGAGVQGSMRLGPAIVQSGLMAGLIYPAIFGGLGGAVAAGIAPDRRAGRRPDRRSPPRTG